jgi:hypothetical protein
MAARQSGAFGNKVQRYRNGLHSLQGDAANFKHVAAQMKQFEKLVDDIVKADAAQEQAKLAQKKATDALKVYVKQADTMHASLKRTWLAKYPPGTVEGKSFDAPAQGKVQKPRAKRAKETK